MMGKLPSGIPTKHVLKSNGADTDIMKFYCTQNSTTYGSKFAKFQPRTGKHTGTGYSSNFRPGVYYSGRLDELDNPVMGHIVAGNYQSITKRDFKPSVGSTGKDPLPNACTQVPSGFVREKPLSIPTEYDVQKVAIDTRTGSAPANLMPRYKPHLHKIIRKDPVELENGGYGPSYMSTETHTRFKGAQPDELDTSKSIGHIEESGFTHNINVEPITYHPHYAHKGDMPGWMTSRPTGVSIMKTHFTPSKFPHGDDPLPKIANRSDHDTGFTSGTKALPVFVNRVPSDAYDKAKDIPPAVLEKYRKGDPAEYINMMNPNNHSSVAKNIYQGKQRPDKTEADRLGTTAVGFKEPTGFSENNDRFIQTDDNPARFITHYMTRFVDRTPVGLEREGHTWGGIQPQKPDGFTKSTQVHSNGKDVDTTATLRRLEPYVSRSIKARDPFFDDHTFDTKLHRSTTMPVY